MTRRNRTALASSAQPDLFSFAGAAGVTASHGAHGAATPVQVSLPSVRPVAEPPKPPQSLLKKAQALRCGSAPVRVVSLDDLPSYPQLDQDLVDQSIAALPAGKMWFTYQAIRECFGVSRATVARRVKKGLVPGIRFSGSRVIEDGSVRRFDRTQLRWLLLSVRSQPN